MALGILLLVMRTKHKILSAVLLAGFLGGSIYLVKDMYVARMSTLEDYQQEGSAASRIIHAKVAFRMWLDYPIVGVGFGGYNYGSLSSRYMRDMGVDITEGLAEHVAHNSYLQMLVDSGPLAFLLYTGSLVYAIVWLGISARRMRKYGVTLEAIPRAIQIPLIAFALGSTFYSCQRMDLPYLFLICAGCWYRVEGNVIAEVETQGAEEPVFSLASVDLWTEAEQS
jgi:O-antigen ligase